MMVHSMTGYGKGIFKSNNYTIVAELKSLNGKTSDIRCRLPLYYNEEEIILRKLVLKDIVRGKVDYQVSVESNQMTNNAAINQNAFETYFNQIKELEKKYGFQSNDYGATILRIPGLFENSYTEVSKEEFDGVLEATKIAITKLQQYRINEGKSIHKDLLIRASSIDNLLTKIDPFENRRLHNIKNRIYKNLEEFNKENIIDQNRYEQEIIYYLEKLDINEEKVRLAQHCIYFTEILNNNQIEKGKKLGFIAQEMGREINTLGAKAQDNDIQKLVVMMKDELEKIKELLFNII